MKPGEPGHRVLFPPKNVFGTKLRYGAISGQLILFDATTVSRVRTTALLLLLAKKKKNDPKMDDPAEAKGPKP